MELTADEKAEHTLRLAATIKMIEESRENPDLPQQAGPTTGRGHKGTVQKVADRAGVDHSSVRLRVRKVAAAIAEPVDLDRDRSDELTRKADKFKAMAPHHKAVRKAARHEEREKTQATKPARQSDLVAAIRDLNVAWVPAAIETAAARLNEAQRADLRHHLPDLIEATERAEAG